MATLFYLLDNWKHISWGDRRVFIPLLIIVAAISLSGVTAETLSGKFAPMFMGIALFALYLASRALGKGIFFPLAVGVAIASLGIIAYGLWHPGTTTGGFVFEHNYDISTGFILLGAAVFIHRWRWLLACLSVVSLLLSGAPEAIFVLGVIGVAALLRRDWSKKVIVLAVVLVAFVAIGLIGGQTQRLYSYVGDTLSFNPVANYVSPEGERTDMSPLDIRVRVIQDAMSNIKPLGDGYSLTDFHISTVHNVPLIIIQQLGWLGILAGAAWLWVTIWCFIKTRWKYAWLSIIALSVFDHYVWTQLAPVWWILIGVSTARDLPSDLIFRKQQPQ
jgi:hypothetical protein